MNSSILKAYELAKESYAAIGVDTDGVLEKLKTLKSLSTAGREMMSTVFCLKTLLCPAEYRQQATIPARRQHRRSCAPTLKRRCL